MTDTTETTREAGECYCGKLDCPHAEKHARVVEDAEIRADAVPLLIAELPPPVADFGPVRLELMGHRYRQGNLSEVVIAGQPFLRLDLEGGGVEFYRPDAVYCITPGIIPPAPPRTAITSRFADEAWGDEMGSF